MHDSVSAPLPTRISGRVLRFCGFRRTVSDLERSIDFYVHALGFTNDQSLPRNYSPTVASVPNDKPSRCARLSLGDESIKLYSPMGYAFHSWRDDSDDAVSSASFQHIAIVTNDMDEAMRRLARYAPQAISDHSAVRLPTSSGGATAFKFRDPDGHALELICIPQGVGDSKWNHATSKGPTLGIDHSAIGVLNVERSLDFYVNVLGFRVASRHINRGPEQARLDGTLRAEVEVVGLLPSGATTPHVELLGYRTPKAQPRHAIPALSQDYADRITFQVDDLAAIAARLDATPHVLRRERLFLGQHALLIRDEDAHLLLLQQVDPPQV